jgi:hypothetical protein
MQISQCQLKAKLNQSGSAKEGQEVMRSLPKVFVVMVGFFAMSLLSSSVRANDFVAAGKFTLAHTTQWNNTMLPAGDYTLRLDRTLTGTDMLVVRGAKQTLTVMINSQSSCASCQGGSLSLAMQGDQRVVTSLQLAGFHVNFKVRKSAESREMFANVPERSEQVAVRVNAN